MREELQKEEKEQFKVGLGDINNCNLTFLL